MVTQQWAGQTKKEILFMAAWPLTVYAMKKTDIRCRTKTTFKENSESYEIYYLVLLNQLIMINHI